MENTPPDSTQNVPPESTPRVKGTAMRWLRRAWAMFLNGSRHVIPLKNYRSYYEKSEVCLSSHEAFAFKTRFFLIIFFFLLFLGPLFFHLFKIQIVQHSRFESFVDSRCRKKQTTDGLRGCIYDQGHTLLAGNITTQNVLVEPKQIKPEKLGVAIQCLSEALDIPPQVIGKRFYEVKQTHFIFTLCSQLPREQAQSIANRRLPFIRILPDDGATPEKPLYKIEVHLPSLKDRPAFGGVLKQIADITGIAEETLQARTDGKKGIGKARQITLSKNVDYMTAVHLNEQLAKLKIPGISISKQELRYYPQGAMLANLVGFLDEEHRGAAGIEKLFETYLRPQKGNVVFLKDAAGKPLPWEGNVSEKPSANGYDIHLTIQQELQSIAEEELKVAIEKYNPKRAYAIMMDPKTGAVMAMAQYPSFDPNDRKTLTDPNAVQPHALTECFEPGSVMKGISLSSGISQGVFSLDSTYFCERGGWIYGGKLLRDTHQNEELTIQEIVKHSSNIGTAKAAIDMGVERLYSGLRAFGFGQQTHIGFYPENQPPVFIKNESFGILRPPERWDKLSITRFPIGQGISCSTIQLLEAYCAIANHGVMMQPYFIDRIVDENKNVTMSVPRVKACPITPHAASDMTRALVTVTEKDGTARRAAVKGFNVAGKTGTAQIFENGVYSETHVTSSFIGFVPAEDPAFVLLVTLSTPRPKVHGGTCSAPVFSKIAERTLAHLRILPKVDAEESLTQR